MKNLLAISILFSSAVAVVGWDTEYQNTPYAYKRFKFDAPGTNSAALGKCAAWYELKSKELAAAGEENLFKALSHMKAVSILSVEGITDSERKTAYLAFESFKSCS